MPRALQFSQGCSEGTRALVPSQVTQVTNSGLPDILTASGMVMTSTSPAATVTAHVCLLSFA